MNILDLQKRLHDKSIAIDSKGHQTNDWIPVLDKAIETLKQSLHSDNHAIVKYTKEILLTPIEHKKRIQSAIGVELKTYCFDCDKEVMPILMDDDHIIMIESWQYWFRQYKKDQYDFSWNTMEIPEKHFHECTFKPIRETGMMTAEINIPSGNIIFANCFQPDEIYRDKENQYKTGHNINSKIGRYNEMQYLAGKDIGYGQMSNTSLLVFVKEDGTEIILGPTLIFDEDDNDHEPVYKGFTLAGEVHCPVWRWQCADKETLNKYENVEISNEGESPVQTTVKPGRWKIEHYYDFTTPEDDRTGHPFARLKLINE